MYCQCSEATRPFEKYYKETVVWIKFPALYQSNVHKPEEEN